MRTKLGKMTTPTVTDLEATFDYYWRILNGPEMAFEYRFCQRRWRFDRASICARVAVEIDGGTWHQGRHTREPGYSNDCEKLNYAVSIGWLVFRLTTKMLNEKPVEHLEMIIRTINERGQK